MNDVANTYRPTHAVECEATSTEDCEFANYHQSFIQSIYVTAIHDGRLINLPNVHVTIVKIIVNSSLRKSESSTTETC